MNTPTQDNPCFTCDPKCAAFTQSADIPADCPSTRYACPAPDGSPAAVAAPRKLRVLVACEFSGTVRDAFISRGHDAMSCDLLPTEKPGPHYQGSVLDVLHKGWDLMIAHPPCTYLSYAATCRWNEPGRCKKRLEALEFFRILWEAPIDRICLENPKGCASPVIAKYSQEIQPFFWGDSAYKTTWLWLKNLPLLKHQDGEGLFESNTSCPPPKPIYVNKNGKAIHFVDACKGGKNRAKNRAKFWPGIADAMADQWGTLPTTTTTKGSER